jgi:hypothetical protein
MINHLMKRIQTTMLLGALAVIMPAAASASVIFTNFGPSLAYDVTQGNSVGNDFVGDNLAQGDSFMPLNTAVFSSATLALSCVTGCPAATNFTIDLTADSSDSPGAIIESFSLTAVSLKALGNNNTPITVNSILNPTLIAGTRYWITVSSSVNYSLVWNNDSTGDTRDQAISSDGGATWFAPSGATPSALEVDSSAATPEPSTAAFLTVAGLLLGLARKRLPVRGV